MTVYFKSPSMNAIMFYFINVLYVSINIKPILYQ